MPCADLGVYFLPPRLFCTSQVLLVWWQGCSSPITTTARSVQSVLLTQHHLLGSLIARTTYLPSPPTQNCLEDAGLTNARYSRAGRVSRCTIGNVACAHSRCLKTCAAAAGLPHCCTIAAGAERRREDFRRLARSFRVIEYGPGASEAAPDPDPVPPGDLNEEERAEAESGQWVRGQASWAPARACMHAAWLGVCLGCGLLGCRLQLRIVCSC